MIKHSVTKDGIIKMKECPKIIKNVLQVLKKHWWYIFLLIISSVYVFRYRYDIFQMTELNAQNLIFILWLVLLGLPLFSEIEIGNVKLKKEIEQTRAEVKESIGELKYQILDLKISNSNSNMLVFNNPPLASKDELSQMQRHAENDDTVRSETNLDFKISEDNIYLFQVRLSLEKQLSVLCNMFQYGERRSMYSMAQFLVQHEVIDRRTADLIREVITIANRGVHGEIIDNDYIQFVRKTYPMIKYTLDKANDFYANNSFYCECPKCHYQGPSKYSNVCPKCGFTSDND